MGEPQANGLFMDTHNSGLSQFSRFAFVVEVEWLVPLRRGQRRNHSTVP